MATLGGGYKAQQRLNPGSTPGVGLSNAVADAVGRVGQSVSQVGADLQARLQKREEFKTDNDYRTLQMRLQDELNKRRDDITPGGDGFHDSFMTEVYAPARAEFLATVPERLRPQFETLLAEESGSDTTEWSIKAATVERDETYRWYKDEIKTSTESLATAIATQPEDYDKYFSAGMDLIKSAGLPTPDRVLLEDQWRRTAQVASLNAMLEKDPQGIFRSLGVDTRNLSPTTQFQLLSAAVQFQESSNNPNAVSNKGAVGLMQVMPATAVDIAKALGDTNFPTSNDIAHPVTPEAIRQYLSNPEINKVYGEYYLKQQLRDFADTRNPVETALVAYNGGPERARKWVESGYDDSVLPKETRDYKNDIMATLAAPMAKGNPEAVEVVGADVASTNGELIDRAKDAFATVGVMRIKVNSAGRSPAENAAVGGADQSQHLDNNALDIDVTGMKIADRVELLKSLSAAGITGLGIYSNAIHIDLGGRRAWGPDHGAGSVPEWAQGVIGLHLKGVAPPPRAVDTRYASLPYDDRQAFLSKADQRITSNAVAANKVSAVEKVQIKQQMDNELALVRATGSGSGKFDEGTIATTLGEDDYLTYAHKRDVAQRTYTATSDMATMTPTDMEQRYKDYAPVEGAADYADQQQIQAAVQRESDRITTMRAKHPDQAALLYPEMKAEYDALNASMANGDAAPDAVQSFVQNMLATQGDFDVPPEARAPVPHDWAVAIGQSLTRVPAAAGKNLPDVKAAIQAQYNELHKYFGDYTDEVVIYALSEYKGLSSGTSEIIGAYMKAIQVGGDPFRAKQLDQALDQDQSSAVWYNPFSWFGGDPPPDADADAPLTTEERLRSSEEETDY